MCILNMRFFIRRYLKASIYFIVVLFLFSLMQKHAEFMKKRDVMEKDDQSNPLDKELHLLNELNILKEKVKVEENVNEAEAIRQDTDDDVEEDGTDEEEEEEEDYLEVGVGPDPLDLKAPQEPGPELRLENIQPKEEKLDGGPLVEKKDDLDFFRERERVYKERRNHIREVCDRLGSEGTYRTLANVPLRRLRWLNKKRLIMCFNAKVGTSTWTQYLMEAGFPGMLKNVTHWHHTAERLLRPPTNRKSDISISMMKKYTKIILVRDPFARIVSAYLDKIARMRFSSLCRFIVRKYRPINSKLNQRQPSFEEFARFLVDQTPISDDIKAKRNHRSDRHWFHYYANCAPCDIQYDIVATMETVHEDTRYIMEKYKLGLKDTVWNNHQAKSSSEEMAIKLFQELPRNLTLELYQRYRVDFMMFGYGYEKYLSP
ncbi:carbohydrate sulfotransferase 11-like [Palaemon carinicauda]|uniref:carbohydrate sulfotransferase 11-like n=1 Tax=Palaemon carinicauda TaxID=392227 RepID=UPI0035B597D6